MHRYDVAVHDTLRSRSQYSGVLLPFVVGSGAAGQVHRSCELAGKCDRKHRSALYRRGDA